MKKLYASLVIASALLTSLAWAPAYDSDSDDDTPLIEFKKFEIGDRISLERYDSNIERKAVFFDGEWYEAKTHTWTQLPQRLIQFRQEGDYYRLYTRPRMDYGFVKQSGLWEYRNGGALSGNPSSCVRTR